MTPIMRLKIYEIGLKIHQVAAKGNCGYLAASKHVFGRTSKWKTVRTEAANHLVKHSDRFKYFGDAELIKETADGMRKDANIDTLPWLAIANTYGRPIEIWRRTHDDNIETDPLFPAADNSILIWYNGF